jgi:hypothetical protein
MEKTKKEETVIERIIRYSNELIMLLLYRNRVSKAAIMPAFMNINLYEAKSHFKEIIDEADRKIFEIKNQIKPLLLSLFQGIVFLGYEDNDNHWFLSTEEMSQGYIVLEQKRNLDTNGNPIGPRIEYVLFLLDYNDHKNNIKAGSLLEKTKFNHILSNQKSVVRKTIYLFKDTNKKILIHDN